MLEPSVIALLTITEEFMPKPSSVLCRIVIETKTLQDEGEIFPILYKVAPAWTGVILAGKRDSRRENGSGEDKLSNVISFIILQLEEGSTFFIK